MKYTKPEVRVIAPAARAIESVDSKQISPLVDHITQMPNSTGAAYEADE